MAIWAIADLHLSFGLPDKGMEIFGDHWENHARKIEAHWRKTIIPEDLILIPGDISWAMNLQQVQPDLDWIESLPGTKVLLKGNHDYWWGSLQQIKRILPPSLHLIQNNVFSWNQVSIGGARLWDTSEYQFGSYIEGLPHQEETTEPNQKQEEAEKIFARELGRLELSLQQLDQRPQVLRIAMTHYPPIGAALRDSRVSALLDRYQVDLCVFGHLHNVRKGSLPFGVHHGVEYALVACDYLNFEPKLLESEKR